MSIFENIFTYFPVPDFLSLAHVGIDITPTSIRFVGLKKGVHGLELDTYGEQALSTTIVQMENLRTNKDLISALKRLRRAQGLNFVEVSIPEDKSYLYTTDVPMGDDESIRNTLEFHLEENVPISLSEAVFDYNIINKNDKTATVAVSVVPRGVADDYVGLLADCGMIPVSFLIENQALSRSIIKRGDRNSYLVVNLGLAKTVLSVVSDEVVQFTSTINIGSEDFTQAIVKEFKITREEALKIKEEKGFTKSKDNENLFASLINTASALKDEISKIHVYWQSYQEKMKEVKSISSIQSIILVGRDASIVGFREYIAISLKVEVELANVWRNVSSFETEIPPIQYLDSLNYATAIGLALPKQTK